VVTWGLHLVKSNELRARREPLLWIWIFAVFGCLIVELCPTLHDWRLFRRTVPYEPRFRCQLRFCYESLVDRMVVSLFERLKRLCLCILDNRAWASFCHLSILYWLYMTVLLLRPNDELCWKQIRLLHLVEVFLFAFERWPCLSHTEVHFWDWKFLLGGREWCDVVLFEL
jgi:hypothetical protein